MARVTVRRAPTGSASIQNVVPDRPEAASRDKRAIQALMRVLKPLADIRGTRMPLSYVIVFLTVALDEGKSVSSYARALGIKNRLTMSRFLKHIGRKGSRGNPGLDLVTSKPDPSVYQGTQIFLTAKGRTIADQISRELGRLSRRANSKNRAGCWTLKPVLRFFRITRCLPPPQARDAGGILHPAHARLDDHRLLHRNAEEPHRTPLRSAQAGVGEPMSARAQQRSLMQSLGNTGAPLMNRSRCSPHCVKNRLRHRVYILRNTTNRGAIFDPRRHTYEPIPVVSRDRKATFTACYRSQRFVEFLEQDLGADIDGSSPVVPCPGS